jgi:hypothetical protein
MMRLLVIVLCLSITILIWAIGRWLWGSIDTQLLPVVYFGIPMVMALGCLGVRMYIKEARWNVLAFHGISSGSAWVMYLLLSTDRYEFWDMVGFGLPLVVIGLLPYVIGSTAPGRRLWWIHILFGWGATGGTIAVMSVLYPLLSLAGADGYYLLFSICVAGLLGVFYMRTREELYEDYLVA